MPSAKDLFGSTPPKILLYGPAGAGKTALAMTLGDKAEMIETDRGGFTTGVTLVDQFQSARQSVEVFQAYDKNGNLADGFDKAKNRIITVSNMCAAGTYPYQALIIDSFSTFCEGAMKYILVGMGRWGVGKASQIQDYGQAITYIEQLLNVIRALPIPVVVIGHESYETVDNVAKSQVIALGSKLPPKIPMYFDEVWYARTLGANASRKYVLQTIASGSILARTRRALPDNTEVSLGLTEIIKRLGYEFPVKEPVAIKESLPQAEIKKV